jgi:hypothetical protein
MKKESDKILNPELIVRYLIGEPVSDSQQAEIERRLFADDEFLEEVQAIELQLMARYLRNDLSPREHELFESHFLLSQERRNELEFARGLSNALDSAERTHEAESKTLETSLSSIHSPSKLNRSRYFLWITNLVGLSARQMRVATLGFAVVLFVGFLLWSFRSERSITPAQHDSSRNSGSVPTDSGRSTVYPIGAGKTSQAEDRSQADPGDVQKTAPQTQPAGSTVNPTGVAKTGDAEDRSQTGPTDAKQTESVVRRGVIIGGVITAQLPDRASYPRKLDEAASLSRGDTSPGRGAQKSEAVQPSEMDRRAISDLLSRYRSAYERKDMAGIRTVFPTIGGREENATFTNFRLAKTIELILNITDIQVAGDSARARASFQMRVVVYEHDQMVDSGLTSILFDLSKADGSWVIQRINR